MNLVRLHYADGSVESFRPVGQRAARIVESRRSHGLTGKPVVAMTDAFGVLVGEALAPRLKAFARWSPSVHAAERLARNAAAELEDDEPFEHKDAGSWIVLAIAGGLVLVGMVASSIASLAS